MFQYEQPIMLPKQPIVFLYEQPIMFQYDQPIVLSKHPRKGERK